MSDIDVVKNPIDIEIVNSPINIEIGTPVLPQAPDNVFTYNFSYGDAPQGIFSLNTGDILVKLFIDYEVPFDGSGTVEIGLQSDIDLFLNQYQSIPQENTSFEIGLFYQATSTSEVFLTITPSGETQGSGKIYLFKG